MINANDFTHIVEATPLVSIDLLLCNGKGQYLLGYRKNRPAKGTWFVPGGRIFKDETFNEALHRLTLKELGVAFKPCQAEFYGVYQHLYPDSFGDEAVTTHYIVLAYHCSIGDNLQSLPKAEHGAYKWLSAEGILAEEQVHNNVKAYFLQELPSNKPTSSRPGEGAIIYSK